MKRNLALLLCVLFVSCLCWGQDFRATILGVVTDPSNAAIPNATIKAIRVGTNETTEVKSNAQGVYTIPYLNPGTYNVEVSAEGFNTLKREGIILQVADKQNLPLTLTVGKLTDSITVIGEQEIISTTSASRGLNFDPIKTQEYPLNGRQSYMLMALTPGVIFTQEEFGATGFSGTRGWDVNGSYKINGGRGGNQFLLNGSPISTDGSWQVAANVDAIQEFKVMTNTYDAQYGRTWGGTVNTTLKSGTNEWHGSGFDYIRNSVLDANTVQNNIVGKPRGKHITHQFGGVIGLPIRKDKDFIFFSDESFRERVPFPRVSDTPPMDLRDGKGFSNWGINIFDPTTTRPCVANVDVGGSCYSTYIRSPFPRNEIPASRISPIGKKILDYYPAPNFSRLTQNYFATNNVGIYRYDQPMGRWDRVINENNRFYALVGFQHGREYRSGNGFPSPAIIGEIGSERTFQNYIADWTRIISPTMVLDVKASFTRFTSMFPNGELGTLTADKLGIKMPNVPSYAVKTAPRINMDDASTIFGNKASWDTKNHFDFAPSVTQTLSRHSVKYGFEYARIDTGNGDPGNANGYFDFRRGWTQQYRDRGQGRTDGSSVASLLLGYPQGGGVDFNDTYYRRNPYFAGYIQDDWKVNNRLTLNLGLRYDVQVPFTELHDRVNSGFDFTTKSPVSDAVIAKWKQLKADYDAKNPTYPYPNPPAMLVGGRTFADKDHRRTYDTDWSNLQPRLGFAFSPVSKTVIRGGFGIFHKTVTQGNLTDGFSQSTPYLNSLDGFTPSAGLTGNYSLQNPYPNGIAVPAGRSLGLLTNIGRGVGFDGRQRVLPRTFEYSFTVERELPWGTVLEASYVGNTTVKDTMGYQMDNVPMTEYLKAQADPAYLDRQIPNPFQGILPANTGYGANSSISAYNLNRPYAQFSGISAYTNPWGRYRYDALQVRLEKRVLSSRNAGVLTFVLSYTFSKAFEANHRLQDWNLQEKPIHELDYQDKPQSLAISGVWDLPVGKGKKLINTSNPVINGIAGGWTFDWIFTYYSGYPVGKPDAIFTCGDYRAKNQNPSRWFNNDKNCYSDRAPYTFRTVEDRFSNIRNPTEPQLNIAMAKNFKYRERLTLQLRGEAFNLMNTPIFRGPDTWWRSDRFGMLPVAQNNFPRLVQVAAKILF